MPPVKVIPAGLNLGQFVSEQEMRLLPICIVGTVSIIVTIGGFADRGAENADAAVHVKLVSPSQNSAVGRILQPDPYGDNIARTPPRAPEEERKGFHLPPGFDIELVASEPQIHKPINMNFDDRGRLWITESVEYPFPAPENRNGRDAIKILEDIGDNGKAKKVITFADSLNIPTGIIPLPSPPPLSPQGKEKGEGAIGYSIPNIYRFSSTKGDDRADQREVLYGTVGYRDTHGMVNSFTWGFDGWIYATHGYANTSTIKGRDGQAITMNSGNSFRIKPDGSHVEQYTWGQVNPFGLCFDPLGNLYSADCHTKPAMMLLRGGYYESFGKPHDGLGFAPEIVERYDDSTAIAGIIYYAADHFPQDFRDQLYIGDVVTHNIINYRLQWHGSTPKTVLQYFLKSDDPWFRPVDIKLGPDGALYVADFYNRIIGHYEVPLDHPGRDRERGRVWRIVYRGEDGKGKASIPKRDWAKTPLAALMQGLADPNLTVRVKAANQLVSRGGPDVIGAVRANLQISSNVWQRVHGLWVLERLQALEDGLLDDASHAADAPMRVHAMRILSERRALPTSLRKLALAGLTDKDPFVQRAAADALAMHPARENIRPLLDLHHAVKSDDRMLLHTVRMALRNQLRPAENWAAVGVAPWTEADARAVADVAPGVPSPEAAAYLHQHLGKFSEGFNTYTRYLHHMARYGNDTVVQDLPAMAQSHSKDLREQVAMFKAIQQGVQARGMALSEAARQWADALTEKLLTSTAGDTIQAGIELAGSLKMTAKQDAVAAIAAKKGTDENRRAAAVAALVGIDAKKHIDLIGGILNDAAEPVGLREKVAQTLAGINQPESHAQLLKALPIAPARLQNVIAAHMTGSPQGAAKLLDAVAEGKASARLLQERIVQIRLEQSGLPNLKERLAQLTKGLPPADQKINELMQRRRTGFLAAKGDVTLGVKVFEKSCANCHQLGGKGTKIGPQLDGIGIRGLDRLLEDILDPNRNVDQAFRATTIALTNGQVVSGLVLREEGEIVVLADNQGKEVRIAKKDIDQRTVSQLSPMPANLSDQIPEADFYHLLAYLLSQRTPVN
jgi:putative heme-binding domain-containing protein